MVSFLKRSWLLILLALLATILVVVNFFITRGPTETGGPPATPAPTWKRVVPGKTNTGELSSLLGNPETTVQEGGKTIFGFAREGGGPSHEVVVENDRVGLVKEKIPGANISTFKTRYGNPEGEYWGPQQDAGFKTYVYPSRGIAVVAGTGGGAIFEVWYFEPTTLSSFLQTWGKDLSITRNVESRF